MIRLACPFSSPSQKAFREYLDAVDVQLVQICEGKGTLNVVGIIKESTPGQRVLNGLALKQTYFKECLRNHSGIKPWVSVLYLQILKHTMYM